MKPKPKCAACGGPMTVTRENYRYTESGLPNVLLVGVEVRRCPACGEEELIIPKLSQLHRVLARAVATKREQLEPVEIRFLRKTLGWSGADFAQFMGVTRESVSRWENGAVKMTRGAERLLRLYATTKEPIPDYEIFKEIGTAEPSHAPYRLTLKEGWELAA